MLKIEKRGDILVGSVVSIIISGAILIVLIWFLIQLTQPFFNEDDAVASAYHNTLVKTLKYAKDTGTDQFITTQDMSPNRYFLIYFGDNSYKTLKSFDEYQFFLKKSPKNTLCICPVSKTAINRIVCPAKYCENLKRPISSFNQNEGLPLEQGTTIDFSYENKEYTIDVANEGILIDNRYSSSSLRKDACDKEADSRKIHLLNNIIAKSWIKSCYKHGSVNGELDVISNISAEYQTDSFNFIYNTDPPTFLKLVRIATLGIIKSNEKTEINLVGKKNLSDSTQLSLEFKGNKVGKMNLLNGNININSIYLNRILLSSISDKKDYTLNSLQEQSSFYSLQYSVNSDEFFIFEDSKWLSSQESNILEDLNFEDGLNELKDGYSDTLVIGFI